MAGHTLASRILHRHLFVVLSAAGSACLAAACRATPAPPAAPISADTWAVVDGRAITRDDVEKAYRRTGDASQPLSEEEALAAKLTLLNDLIVQDILLAKARELKLEVTDSELDTAYAEARKNTPGRGVSAGADATQPDGGGHA